MKQLPVYLFSGFLESGKTKFIQGTLSDPTFNTGEKTLLIVCEEGIEEYEPEKFSGKNVTILNLEAETDLNAANLEALGKKLCLDRVMIEYNGMWPLQTLFDNLPESWPVSQHFCFVDSTTFPQYFANIRQRMLEWFQDADIVVFNRYDDSMDKLPMHRAVKMVNRRADIAYELPNGEAEYDNIEDPPPYDMNADIIEIKDEDYGLFFLDAMDHLDRYLGKTVRFKAVTCITPQAPRGCFAVGRFAMTCCADDVSFLGILCKWGKIDTLKQRGWITVTAKVEETKHRVYDGRGPLLVAQSVEPAEPAKEELVYFV